MNALCWRTQLDDDKVTCYIYYIYANQGCSLGKPREFNFELCSPQNLISSFVFVLELVYMTKKYRKNKYISIFHNNNVMH